MTDVIIEGHGFIKSLEADDTNLWIADESDFVRHFLPGRLFSLLHQLLLPNRITYATDLRHVNMQSDG